MPIPVSRRVAIQSAGAALVAPVSPPWPEKDRLVRDILHCRANGIPMCLRRNPVTVAAVAEVQAMLGLPCDRPPYKTLQEAYGFPCSIPPEA